MSHRCRVPRTTTLALTLSLMPGLASSGLTDPTRPLTGMAPVETASTGAVRGAVPVAAPAPAPAEPQLQSLQLPRDGQASALVDGQLLRAGQRWNAFEILAIDAQGVLAKGPGGPQRWTLVGVQYLDPKARPRLSPVVQPPPAASTPSAVSTASEAMPAVPLQTAQWRFTPLSAATTASPQPPVTRLSWADLVAPSARQAEPAPTPRLAPKVLRLPTTPAKPMSAVAGPVRGRIVPSLAAAQASRMPTWRGLRFEWPARAEALPRQPVASARGPLRGPVPPSLVLARRSGPTAGGLRWSTTGPATESIRTWWTPAPAVTVAKPEKVAPTAAAPRSAGVVPAARTWARAAMPPAPALSSHTPIPPVLPRTSGPRLLGVVALNKELP